MPRVVVILSCVRGRACLAYYYAPGPASHATRPSPPCDQGGKRRNWNTRYFELLGTGTLQYFHDVRPTSPPSQNRA